jgi:predicted  nucleic acid-binding Zn-ribbon protein
METRLSDYESQIEKLNQERSHLLEEIRNNASSSVQPDESEKASGTEQHDKLVKINTKLKRALQTFKEKIHRLATGRPDLFANVGEETTERFDHLISTVEHQATQIDLLQSEHNDSEEQLRNEIQELQRYE